MEYVYAALLLHKAGHPVNEASMTKVLDAANVKVDSAKVKALVNALGGVDIEKVIKEAGTLPIAAAAPSAPKHEEKKEEKKKEDEKKTEEAAAAGLGALFG